MLVPFVDLKREALLCKSELVNSFEAVIESGSYISGDYVTRFEENICEYLNVQHCVSVGNGSDALVFILRSLGIGPGDEVICPANSFIATSWAIRAVGAIPVFCDVNSDLLFSTDSFLQSVTSRTRGLIAVHLAGRVCDIESIEKYCTEHSIFILEDAAQAFGAYDSHKRFTGTLGRAGAFSLHPLKNLAIYGDGGMITTNDDSIAQQCRLLRNHGLENRDSSVIWGFNSRLDELQAAFALVKLAYIEEWTERYVEIATKYSTLISDSVVKPIIRSRPRDVYHNYVILVPSSVRDLLQELLLADGVQTRIHYPIPLHKQGCYTSEFGCNIRLPNTESYASQMISLPIYPMLTNEEINYVISTLNRHCQNLNL